jgi:tetratricopeptide (TPR) repeat protein
MEYYFGLAVDSYFMAGHLEEFLSAEEMIKDGQISASYKAVIFNQIGNLYSGKTLHSQAAQFYRKAIELDAGVPIYHNNLGLMYQSLEYWSDAIDCFLASIKLRRTSADDQYSFDYYYKQGATAFFRAGRISEFLLMVESEGDFVKDSAGMASLFNVIGNLYNGSSETLKALDYYEKASILEPETAVYHSNIGVMQAVLQNWAKATEYQDKAIELALKQNAEDEDLVYYAKLLGEAYGQLNLMKTFGDRLLTLKLSVDDLLLILNGLEAYFRDEKLNNSADWCKEKISELGSSDH